MDIEKPNEVDMETHKKIEMLLEEYPRLDYLMAYCLIKTPLDRLKEIHAEAKKMEPPKDFLEKASLTIEKPEEKSEEKKLESINELFSNTEIN